MAIRGWTYSIHEDGSISIDSVQSDGLYSVVDKDDMIAVTDVTPDRSPITITDLSDGTSHQMTYHTVYGWS